MWQKKCNTCNLYLPQQKTCQIMGQLMAGKVEPDGFCKWHNDHVARCEYCGAGTLEPVLTFIGDEVHVYCFNCIQQIR